MRTRRIGSFTCGILLILFGILFILHMIMPLISYELIFRFWPLILIFLGAEMLIANFKSGEQIIKYDIAGIFLVLLLAVFSLGMGVAEYIINFRL